MITTSTPAQRDVHAFDVANEVDVGHVFELRMSRFDGLGAFVAFAAIAEQGHGGFFILGNQMGISRAQDGEAHQIIAGDFNAEARIENGKRSSWPALSRWKHEPNAQRHPFNAFEMF